MDEPVTNFVESRSTSVTNETAAFNESVAGLIERVWGDARRASQSKVGDLWTAGAEQGWFELEAAGALELAVQVSRRLGGTNDVQRGLIARAIGLPR
jgi:hypothetical protein